MPAGTATGVYYVIASADVNGAVLESQETNNTRSALVRIGPDLGVAALTAPANAAAGSVIAVSDTTSNTGGGSAGASVTRFYLSTNAAFDAGDVLLGSRSIGPLAAAASSVSSSSLTIPATTPGGLYYILATADANAQVVETTEQNNTRASGRIAIGADLTVSALAAPPSAGCWCAIHGHRHDDKFGCRRRGRVADGVLPLDEPPIRRRGRADRRPDGVAARRRGRVIGGDHRHDPDGCRERDLLRPGQSRRPRRGYGGERKQQCARRSRPRRPRPDGYGAHAAGNGRSGIRRLDIRHDHQRGRRRGGVLPHQGTICRRTRCSTWATRSSGRGRSPRYPPGRPTPPRRSRRFPPRWLAARTMSLRRRMPAEPRPKPPRPTTPGRRARADRRQPELWRSSRRLRRRRWLPVLADTTKNQGDRCG